MRATAVSPSPSLADACVPSLGAVWAELFKARLSTLVLLTTAVGFHLGSPGPISWWRFLWTVTGTSLLAAGAGALNQWWERDLDRLMPRTAHRPLPAGQVAPRVVLGVGAAVSVVGMGILTLWVNPLTGLLGVLTLGTYLFVYTPLKRRTTLNTLIGAIPGALPPLMGWTAATGSVAAGGWSLFTILFFWQMPHFMAIAWRYREDYRKGGYRMLPTVDPDGWRTGVTAVRHAAALLAFSLGPFALGLAGRWYLVSALALGALFLVTAIQFAAERSDGRSRRLFLSSIVYLPLLLIALVGDKVQTTGEVRPGDWTVTATNGRLSPVGVTSISTDSR